VKGSWNSARLDGEKDPRVKSDLLLVQSLFSGQEEAWSEFLHRHSDLVYSFCTLVFPEPNLEEEYLNVLRTIRSDGFGLLRGFDGRAKLSTYLTLKIADLLSARILRLFQVNSDRAWGAFERLFKRDIIRIISRHSSLFGHQETLQDGSTPEDLYQEICCLLVDQGYQRILSYDGRGSFTGYIRRVVQNLYRDIVRKADGRRRLPERIQRLPELEQEIFRLLHWDGLNKQELFEVSRDETGKPFPKERMEEALARVTTALSTRSSGGEGVLAGILGLSFGSKAQSQAWNGTETLDYRSPEGALMESEEQKTEQRVLQVVQDALSRLSVEERLYVEHRFYTDPPRPPREIACLMGRSEQEIYKIRKQVMSSLKSVLKAKGIDKFPLPVRLERWGDLL
jgi:RNA polymerase primary sigma factor